MKEKPFTWEGFISYPKLFKWVDGKIVMENWIFDPTSDITEAAAK